MKRIQFFSLLCSLILGLPVAGLAAATSSQEGIKDKTVTTSKKAARATKHRAKRVAKATKEGTEEVAEKTAKGAKKVGTGTKKVAKKVKHKVTS
ncbi:MAG TPA: hypothetical protein VGQ81_16660 [Acidobacteriota bacterium]|jgi:hypothetical protein|nr:hypothetical protein [Acidobacteriota bacterium]